MRGDGRSHLCCKRIHSAVNGSPDGVERSVHHRKVSGNHRYPVGTIAAERELRADPTVGILVVITQRHGVGERPDHITLGHATVAEARGDSWTDQFAALNRFDARTEHRCVSQQSIEALVEPTRASRGELDLGAMDAVANDLVVAHLFHRQIQHAMDVEHGIDLVRHR